MLRIWERNGSAEQTIQLEGQIVGPWVDELRRTCERGLERDGRLTLSLAGVAFVSREGVALLQELAGRGVRLVDGSPFVREQIRGG